MFTQEFLNHPYDTLCKQNGFWNAIAASSVAFSGVSTGIQALKSLSMLKLGPGAFMMVNNIQMARTSTLISPKMSEVVRTFLNSDF